MKIEIARAEWDVLNKALYEYHEKARKVFREKGVMNVAEINIIENMMKRIETMKEKSYV